MLLTACFQKISPWLYAPLDRRGRAYLECHLDLLDAESDEFLELFIAEYREKPEEQNRLRLARHILRDAIKRGKTAEAVRDTYVNVFGGLILDPPAWLQEIEQQWMSLLAEPWTDRRAALSKLQIKGALEQAVLDPSVPLTMCAELQFLQGNLFANDFLKRSTDIFETIVNCYTAALQVYTADSYPLRRAKILLTLGDVYRRQAADQRADLLFQAANYYGQALDIYNNCEPV